MFPVTNVVPIIYNVHCIWTWLHIVSTTQWSLLACPRLYIFAGWAFYCNSRHVCRFAFYCISDHWNLSTRQFSIKMALERPDNDRQEEMRAAINCCDNYWWEMHRSTNLYMQVRHWYVTASCVFETLSAVLNPACHSFHVFEHNKLIVGLATKEMLLIHYGICYAL